MFLHFYPGIVDIISSFATLVSKVSYSGTENVVLLGQMCKVGFSGCFFASPNLCPIKQKSPRRGVCALSLSIVCTFCRLQWLAEVVGARCCYPLILYFNEKRGL